MYTPEQVTLAADRMRVACREELEIERMLYAYAATLRQTPERGVTEAMVERVSLAIYARAMESGKRLEPTFCDDLATAALSAEPAAQGEAVNVPGYDVGWKIRGVTAYDEAKRKGYRHPECVEAAIKAAPPAQPADPTDPGTDVSVLREQVRHLERRIHELHAQLAERVPEGWVLVPREALGYVSDLLAERKHGTAGRSPAHNARVVVDYWLASPAPSEGGKWDETECNHKWVAKLGHENAGQRCDWCGEARP